MASQFQGIRGGHGTLASGSGEGEEGARAAERARNATVVADELDHLRVHGQVHDFELEKIDLEAAVHLRG